MGFFKFLAFGDPAHHTGDHNRRHTSKGLELNLHQAGVFDFDLKGYHIAADGFARFADTGRILDNPGIPGIGKMAHNGFAVNYLSSLASIGGFPRFTKSARVMPCNLSNMARAASRQI